MEEKQERKLFPTPWNKAFKRRAGFTGKLMFNIKDANGDLVCERVRGDAANVILAAPLMKDALIRIFDCMTEMSMNWGIGSEHWPDNPIGNNGMLKQIADALAVANGEESGG